MEEKRRASVSVKELQKQLMEAKQAYAELYNKSKEQIQSMNLTNNFKQQDYMFKIVELSNKFPKDMVEKAIEIINTFWFSEEEVESESK